MDALLVGIGNWRTTVVGLLTAVVIYEMGVGNKIPENKQEWAAFVLGVLALALGISSKDAKVGSRPQALIFAVGLSLTLAGCGGLLYPAMTPEQLHEMAKVKDASVTCFAGTYAGAKVNALIVSADKGVPAGVQIDSDCKASFLSGTKAGP